MLSSKKSRLAGKTFFFKLFLLITIFVMSSGDLLAQVNWTKYSGNPVLPAGQNGTWDRHKFMPSILYNSDSLRYELWYSASIGPSGGWRPYRIGYATSEDGINWIVRADPVLTPGTTGEWDESTVEAAYVIRENGQYKMWYTSAGGIGYAISPDGINWTKYSGNPIFIAGTQSWEAGGVYLGCVMPVTGGYKMWYSGWNTGGTHESIGYATSTDGIFWQRDTLNNPVMEDGSSGTWDDVGVYLPSVLLIDNYYYMWYGGMGSIVQIGLATSPDGINWSKHPANPVLKPSLPGHWDDYYVEEGRVIVMDDTLYMWYGASGGSGSNYVWQIGLAKSFFIPLPVELASFTATSNGKEVILIWTTATELNNQLFEVQRSFEGSEFATIGFVNGKGTTTERQDYTYRDNILTDGKYSYRLKQIDYLGGYEYSDIIDIELRVFNSYLLEQNYPNPFNPTTTIAFGIENKSYVKITILNAIGEEVALLLNEEKEPGYHQVEFNAANLPSGVYFYQLKTGEFVQTKKMVLLK
jgi:predicted GH43/DUF377 family glycosyl hydrolase